MLGVLLPVTGTAPGEFSTSQLHDQSNMLAEFFFAERHSTRSLDKQHGNVSPNGRKSWRTSTGTCWVLRFGGLLPLEPLQRHHLLPLQLPVVLSEAGNCLLLPHCSLSGTITARFPIACSNTFSGARASFCWASRSFDLLPVSCVSPLQVGNLKSVVGYWTRKKRRVAARRLN